jgi:DNA-binding MarR family transcriptional regulator
MGLLSQLNRVVYRRATEDFLGMKLKQLITLELLANQEGCLQQELGATLMIDPNNCVLLLNDLDDRGYVERQRDPRDRRRHIVVITATGLKALDKGQAKLEELEGEVLANLDIDDRERLRGLLAHAMEGQDGSVDVSCLEE